MVSSDTSALTEPRATNDQTDSFIENALDLDAQICFPVTVASRLLVQSYKDVLDPLGLTHPQYLVMLALWNHWDEHPDPDADDAGIASSDLAKLLHFEMATLTLLLRRLESRDLVVRIPDPQDERRRNIRLTAKGLALEKQAEPVPHQMVAKLGLDLEQLGTIREAAHLLVSALTEEE